MLDLSTLVLAGVEGVPRWTAARLYRLARRVAVEVGDLRGGSHPAAPAWRRPPTDLAAIRAVLVGAGLRIADDSGAPERLAALTAQSEPHLAALAEWLHAPLPHWLESSSGGTADPVVLALRPD